MPCITVTKNLTKPSSNNTNRK